MKRKSSVVFAALLALAFASLVQAQDTTETPYQTRYRRIGLIDPVSATKGDWNAVCKVNTNDTILWVVGDSGKVRRYQVEIDDTLHIPKWDTSNVLSFSLGPQYTLCDVCFPNQQYGYIVGYTDTCYTVETTGPSVPGKGYIWYTHTGGGNPTDWHIVDYQYMPPAFQQRPIPCLSVDFYDDMHGYVGCGCGYVLYSNDRGVSWRALRDTTLEKKPPWDSVGFHIGSIPRKYHVGEGYYNHFGDWYWDIKAPNASNVYVASDNNGVFFETTDSRTFLPISEISSN